MLLRRAYATATRDMLPPNLAIVRKSASGGGRGGMPNLVEFYQRIPKGDAPAAVTAPSGGGPIARYRRAYFGKNGSYKPIVHAIWVIGLGMYALDYQFHLKHHKNVEHH